MSCKGMRPHLALRRACLYKPIWFSCVGGVHDGLLCFCWMLCASQQVQLAKAISSRLGPIATHHSMSRNGTEGFWHTCFCLHACRCNVLCNAAYWVTDLEAAPKLSILSLHHRRCARHCKCVNTCVKRSSTYTQQQKSKQAIVC